MSKLLRVLKRHQLKHDPPTFLETTTGNPPNSKPQKSGEKGLWVTSPRQ